MAAFKKELSRRHWMENTLEAQSNIPMYQKEPYQYQTVAEAIAYVCTTVHHRGFIFQDMNHKERYYSFPKISEVTSHIAAHLQTYGLHGQCNIVG